MAETTRGRFVVLEGLDGAGTTSQASRLVARLLAAGRRAHLTAEPSGGPFGSGIRQVLTGRIGGGPGPFDRKALALLFAADRLDHLRAEVEPRLAAGVDVVCDRYVLSSLAYQSLDAPMAWIAEVNRFAPAPDVTLFLRVRPEVALGRREAASTGTVDLFERLPLQRKIARAYEKALVDHGRRHRVVELDGELPLDEVTEACWAALSRRRPR